MFSYLVTIVTIDKFCDMGTAFHTNKNPQSKKPEIWYSYWTLICVRIKSSPHAPFHRYCFINKSLISLAFFNFIAYLFCPQLNLSILLPYQSEHWISCSSPWLIGLLNAIYALSKTCFSAMLLIIIRHIIGYRIVCEASHETCI